MGTAPSTDLHAHDLAPALLREPHARVPQRGVVREVHVVGRPLAPERVVALGADEAHGLDAKGGGAPRQSAHVVLLGDVVHDEVAHRLARLRHRAVVVVVILRFRFAFLQETVVSKGYDIIWYLRAGSGRPIFCPRQNC